MDDQEKRTELLSWVARGVLECLSSTRGAAMFGSKAIAKAKGLIVPTLPSSDPDGPERGQYGAIQLH